MADYPLPNFHFMVEWGGAKIGFTRVRNLAMSNSPMAIRHGASPEYSNANAPTQRVFENFFLDRPVFRGDNEFYEWWRETVRFEEGGQKGSVYRRDITISLLNENHEPVVSWRIESAYPVRLSYSDLDAYGRGPLMETLEICCEGIRVVNE